MIQAIIKFGCIIVNSFGKFSGNIMPSGAVLVSGISNAGINIPQQFNGLNFPCISNSTSDNLK